MEVCDKVSLVVKTLGRTGGVRVDDALRHEGKFGEHGSVPPGGVLAFQNVERVGRIFILHNMLESMGLCFLEIV